MVWMIIILLLELLMSPIRFDNRLDLVDPIDDWADKVHKIGLDTFDNEKDADIFESQMRWESAGYQEDVLYGKTVGGAGERGGPQYTPLIAKSRGIVPGNPQADFEDASKLMKTYLGKYNNDWTKALAAYNAGEPSVDTSMEKYGADWLKGIPASTRTGYLPSVLSRYYGRRD